MTLSKAGFNKIAAPVLALAVAACANNFEDGSQEKVFRFPTHTVTLTRSGCAITSATFRSLGPPSPRALAGTLTVAARGTTSLSTIITCPPVVAGGQALCTIGGNMGVGAPAETAGVGCGGWDSFNLS